MDLISEGHRPQDKIYFDLHPREIRLVTLRKGSWPEEIFCKLSHAPLGNKPAYKALSYAWGSPRATRPILLNGQKHSVTVNLESALRRMRQAEHDIALWVDALCINQSNNLERTQQVELMHDIFSSTEEVLVYLGEVLNHDVHSDISSSKNAVTIPATIFHCDNRDSDNLEIFRHHCIMKKASGALRAKAKLDYSFEVFCLIRSLAEGSDLELTPPFDANSREYITTSYHRNLFEGLRLMMLSRWWNRIWVIQEVVVPKKVTVIYGSSVASWSMFVRAANSYSQNRSSSTLLSFPPEYTSVLGSFARITLDIDRMRGLWRSGKQTALLPLLRRFGGRKATDDRDKVYALLSLAREGTSLTPNYQLAVPKVFLHTVLDIIKTTKSLKVLSGDLGRKDRQDLPSWVPDWSATYDDLDRRRADNTEHYDATKGSLIYLQQQGAREWSGIGDFIKALQQAKSDDKVLSLPVKEKFTAILDNPEWKNYLPNFYHRNEEPSYDECLEAVEDFFMARGGPVCLRDHGEGVVSLPGLKIDRIIYTGEMALSDDEELLSVIDSWAVMAGGYYEHEFGSAFTRTLCADIVNSDSSNEGLGTRRLWHEDLSLLAGWCIRRQGLLSSLEEKSAWNTLLRDTINPETMLSPPAELPIHIDTAIRSASVRRRFFITARGYMGLGPAKMHPGDGLYILLGGQTPFILRDAGSRNLLRRSSQPILGKVEKPCLEVVGDCYTSGLMDGEAMEEWKKTTHGWQENATIRQLFQKWTRLSDEWRTLNSDSTNWKQVSCKPAIMFEVRQQDWPTCGPDEYNLFRLENDLDEMNGFPRPGRFAEGEESQNSDAISLKKELEEVKSWSGDLLSWKEELDRLTLLSRIALHAKAAKLKIRDIEDKIADVELHMDSNKTAIEEIE